MLTRKPETAKKPFTACSPSVKPVSRASGSSEALPVVTLKAWETTTASASRKRRPVKALRGRASASATVSRPITAPVLHAQARFDREERPAPGGRAAVALDP